VSDLYLDTDMSMSPIAGKVALGSLAGMLLRENPRTRQRVAEWLLRYASANEWYLLARMIHSAGSRPLAMASPMAIALAVDAASGSKAAALLAIIMGEGQEGAPG